MTGGSSLGNRGVTRDDVIVGVRKVSKYLKRTMNKSFV